MGQGPKANYTRSWNHMHRVFPAFTGSWWLWARRRTGTPKLICVGIFINLSKWNLQRKWDFTYSRPQHLNRISQTNATRVGRTNSTIKALFVCLDLSIDDLHQHRAVDLNILSKRVRTCLNISTVVHLLHYQVSAAAPSIDQIVPTIVRTKKFKKKSAHVFKLIGNRSKTNMNIRIVIFLCLAALFIACEGKPVKKELKPKHVNGKLFLFNHSIVIKLIKCDHFVRFWLFILNMFQFILKHISYWLRHPIPLGHSTWLLFI